MKLKVFAIIATVILLVGLGFLLFPPISNWIGQMTADAETKKFDSAVESTVDSVTSDEGRTITTAAQAKEAGMVDDKGRPVDSKGNLVYFKMDLDRLYRDSVNYNRELLTRQGKEDTTHYEYAVFNLRDYGISDGIYCYITIPDISLRLPVYLGANDLMMSYGAAHLYGTSLPVGDDDITCGFAGHTNYIGRIFFDNIRALDIGSEVQITTWWEKTTYRVIDYKIVKPSDSSDLVIEHDKQRLTLITCISDGEGGFDRYLVICEKAQKNGK